MTRSLTKSDLLPLRKLELRGTMDPASKGARLWVRVFTDPCFPGGGALPNACVYSWTCGPDRARQIFPGSAPAPWAGTALVLEYF